MDQKFTFLKKYEEYKKQKEEQKKQEELGQRTKEYQTKRKFNKEATEMLKNIVENGNTLFLDTLKELIKQGADINVKDMYGETALKWVCSNFGNETLDLVKCLVQNGADVNAHDISGWTALMHACFWGDLNVVKYLVENGADIYVKNRDGRTALMIAERECYEDDIVTYLKEQLEKKNNNQNEISKENEYKL